MAASMSEALEQLLAAPLSDKPSLAQRLLQLGESAPAMTVFEAGRRVYNHALALAQEPSVSADRASTAATALLAAAHRVPSR